ILANREADAQRAQQPEPQPEDAQRAVNEHVAAQRQAHADALFANSVQRAEAGLRYNYLRLKGQTTQEFPDVVQAIRAARGDVAIARLNAQRAARWQQLEGVHSHLENSWAGTQQAKHHFMAERSGAAQAARQQQYARWAAGEDARVVADEPMLRGPDAEKLQHAEVDVLRESGLSDAEISNIRYNPPLGSAAAQKVMLAAAKQRLAARGLAEARAEAKRKPAPRVLRPGNGTRSSPAGHELATLSAELDKASGPAAIRAAA